MKKVVKKPAKKMQMGGKATKKKTAMDAVKEVGKYVSTFGGATERDNPKQKDINIVKKLKETGSMLKSKLGLKKGGAVKKAQNGIIKKRLGKNGEDTLEMTSDYAKRLEYAKMQNEFKKAKAALNTKLKKKAKSGGSFPDLNKDGKITKADILKGRGVIAKKGAKLKKQAAVAIAMKKAGKTPKTMKSGGKMKKCEYGCK